jgi:hypothetical protein
MNRRLFVLGLMLAAFAQSVTSQEPVFQRELLVGSWKVNWEKSKPEAGVTASQLPSIYRQYEEQGEGFMLHTVIMVDAAQKHAWTLIGVIKYDGKEYPTYAGKSLADRLASGKQPLETVAFRVVDAYNLEWTDRTNGKLTGTGTVALSKDGKTMTDTNRAYDSDGKEISMQVLVYEKQPEDQ